MPDTITAAVPQQTPPQDAILHPAQVYFLSRRLPGIVHLVQYDQSLPYLAVELYEGDEPYTVPEGAAVNIRMAKPVPSSKKVYNPAYGISEDRHTVYIAVTPQMTVVAGCTNPVIEVVVDGGIACTGTLRLEIDPNPVQESDLIDSDEYKTLEEILAEAQAAAQIVADNEQALQDVHNNLSAIQNAAANAQAAAASAQDAEDAADRAAIESQKALGFRSYFGGQVVPDANGDLDPSRPMSTPTAASVTIKARGDRIAGLTMAGKTTQAGTGDPSPDNIRAIKGVGKFDFKVVLNGRETWHAYDGKPGLFWTDIGTKIAGFEGTDANIRTNRLAYTSVFASMTTKNFIFQSVSISANALRFVIKVDDSSTNPADAKAEVSANPIIVWYRSVNYATHTGPWYTVVELSQNPYRAVGFELNQPLFDGDSLKVGVPSGCDKQIKLDGSAVQVVASGGNYAVSADDAAGPAYASGLAGLAVSDGVIIIPDSSFPASVTDASTANSWLQDNPQTVFYRSTEYTEENDIPVAIEKHETGYRVLTGEESNWLLGKINQDNTYVYQSGSVGATGEATSSFSHFKQASSVLSPTSSPGKTNQGWVASEDAIRITVAHDVLGTTPESTDGVSKLKGWLSSQYSAGTPVQVVYKLATPVSYARPVPTMIAQPGEDGTFTVTGENSLSVLLKAFQDGGDAATINGYTWSDILAAIKEQLLPVGSIIEWCPVSGGPDLSTPAKVAAYYGFGQWEAFGVGRSTVGADSAHGAGATWGEASHTLTEDELPHLSGQIGSGEGSISGGSGSSGVFRLGESGIVNTDGVGAVFNAPQMVGADSRVFGRAVNIEFGGGQAHNNWQPSVAVYRYRRIA